MDCPNFIQFLFCKSSRKQTNIRKEKKRENKMWVLQRVSLQCFLVLFCGLYFSIISCQEENDNVGSGNGGVKRKSKRVQESKFKNNMYDQIAQESDHDSGNGNINSNNNNIHLSSVPYTAYGMRIQNNIPNNNNDNNNKARNPRAEPNYMRNYHYSSRGILRRVLYF